MPIRQLEPDVAAKIAAGEVVERPASVVKELIENSIDAGATQIRVDLVNGGLQLIRITDNGCGIPSDELPLALTRHATSKVAQIVDLESIRSLGFRGEALASIAAVAEVTLVSRHQDAEQAAEISASSGHFSEVKAAASPPGTIITVRNLFSSVPARLKFLKSRNTEVSHCHHLLEQYALAYPEIRFSVTSENKPIFNTPGDGQLSSVLLEIYGLTVVDQMVPIQGEVREDDPEYPRVTGYVSRPTCYKSTRQHLSFFVNRRWVLSRMLNAAVEEAYHSLLLSGRHPIAIVNIEVDPAHIDVNVHPAKTEIRFLKERRIYAALMRATRKAVLEEAEIPTWGQRGPASSQPAPAQSSPATKNFTNDWSLPAANHPTPDRQAEPANMNEDTLEGDPELDAILNAPIEPASIQAEQALPLNQQDTRTIQNQFPRDNPWLTVTEEENGTRPPMQSRLWQSHIRAEASTRTGQRSGPLSNNPVTEAPQPVTDAPQPETGSLESQTTTVRPEEPVEIFSLPETSGPTSFLPDPTMRKLPPLRVIGQLSQSFIVTEGPDGMFLIDQHAAHERILLERMVASLQARTPLSQLLLTPIELELTPGEVGAIEDHMSQLEQIGFTFKLHDNNYLETHAIPNVLMKQINALSLREILADLTAPESLGHAETWEEHALANVACKAAIKANYFLTVSEMREMIEQLEGTKAPFSCCHGRPTMVHFSRSALENEFGRR